MSRFVCSCLYWEGSISSMPQDALPSPCQEDPGHIAGKGVFVGFGVAKTADFATLLTRQI